MGKRILLFVLTNLLVILTLSIIGSVLGIRPYISAYGMDYTNLAFFALLWGFGGALISLMLSKVSAKFAMGIQVIDPMKPGEFGWLLNMVEQLSKSAGLPRTPEVGVWNGPEMNAFATGPTKGNALVAFSAGLLQNMSRDEIEGVAAHEIAHVANGDMVTMTLIQGVINAFVIFFARALSFLISSRSSDENSHGSNFLLTMVLEVVLSFLGMIVVAWFSRQREFRADAGGAMYAGRERMIAGLEKLKRFSAINQEVGETAPSLATMKISSQSSKFLSLFATHPPLEVRIEALRAGR